MEVKIDRSFQKDSRKIKDKELLSTIADFITSVIDAENINQIKNLKRLKSSSGEYRIKTGNYRLESKFLATR